jgi:hypothetical protein
MTRRQDSDFWKKVFWFTLVVSCAVRLFLAWKLPLIGDEAYYVMWGKYPALGYYDQPPMIGWVLAVMRIFGTAPGVQRLPSVFAAALIAPLLVHLIQGRNPTPRSLRAAYQGGVLFLLAPVNFLAMFLATDTPLVVFSVLCFYFFYRSLQENRLSFAGVAGVFLGLAFLSKYFVVLLALSFVVYLITQGRLRRNGLALVLMALTALPFGLLHLFWNASHCWINLVFNTLGRNVNEGFRPENPLRYLGFQLYLIGPILLYQFIATWRERRATRQSSKQLLLQPGEGLFLTCFAIPLLCFGLSSFKAAQGFHWMLSFYPYLYLIAARVLSEKRLLQSVRWSAVYTALHALGVLVAMSLSVERWQDRGFYPGLKMLLAMPGLSEVMESYSEQYVLAADGYTEAALFEAALPHRVHVLGAGPGSLFGREDDLLTDFRKLSGQNILLFSRHKTTQSDLEPFFDQVEQRDLWLEGMSYQLFLAKGFRYPVYRDRVLAAVRDQFYGYSGMTCPSWGECSIMSRYFE